MRTEKLGSLVSITGGGTPDRSNASYWGGSIPWVTVKDFKSLRIEGALEHITSEGLSGSASNVIPAGAIILPTRMALGKAAISTKPVAINQDLKALQVLNVEMVDRDFLFRFLLSKASYFESRGKGATVKGITLDVLRDLDVPLPSKSEQQRIAGILEKADSLRRKRHETIRLADEFLRGVFFDMFGDPVSNAKHLPTQVIEQLCSVATGATPSRERSDYFGGAHAWIKTGEVDCPWITNAEEHITDAAINETNCKIFPERTILIAMYGQGKTRGKVGMLGMPAATNQACAAILPSASIDPFFLYVQLSMMYQYLRAMGRGGNQENLNLGMIKSLPVLMPPAGLVNRFLAIHRQSEVILKKGRIAEIESARLVESLASSFFN